VALHDSENTLKTAFSMAPGPFRLHQLSKMGLAVAGMAARHAAGVEKRGRTGRG
jgi:hypothetical protein